MIATSTTILLVFIFTGELIISIGVGLFEFLLKIILYVFHERVWHQISYGRTH